mmetsp:Transcript_61259/g.141420  ORF Transcript_61259/g.141420 Transcript_61259/m.141420 type:complete len:246 (+) Transcript_61259:41-778(+)
MNICRFTGDLLHVIAVTYFLKHLWTSKSCAGLSRGMQEMYLIVFLTRYLPTEGTIHNVYLIGFKIFFISTALAAVALMRFHPVIKTSYNAKQDSLNYWVWCVPPALLLAIASAMLWQAEEVRWTFSLWLEAFAVVPQLYMLRGSCDLSLVPDLYIDFLAKYRLAYFINWLWRSFGPAALVIPAQFEAGAVQLVLYFAFFWRLKQLRQAEDSNPVCMETPKATPLMVTEVTATELVDRDPPTVAAV